MNWLFSRIEKTQTQPARYLDEMLHKGGLRKTSRSILLKRFELRAADPKPVDQETSTTLFIPSSSELPLFDAYRERLFAIFHSLDTNHDGTVEPKQTRNEILVCQLMLICLHYRIIGC